MPVDGGLDDQPANFVAMMSILRQEIAAEQDRERERERIKREHEPSREYGDG